MNITISRVAIVTTALTAIVPMRPVLAQTGERATAASGQSDRIEDIVVTARRRAETLQTTPVAVTAFTAQALETRGMTSLADVGRFAPNVAMAPGASLGGGADLQISIRGLGTNDYSAAIDPTVGIYVDGVYLARPVGAILDLLDIERLEVLRGPQGVLFGKNTPAGAINITSKVPSGDFGGFGEVTLGNYSRVHAKGSVEFALVPEKVAARVSVSSKHRRGYGETAVGRAGKEKATSGRVLVSVTPSDRLSILLSGDYTDQDQTPLPVAVTAVEPDGNAGLRDLYNAVTGLSNTLSGTNFQLFNPVVATNPLRSTATDQQINRVKAGGGSMTLDWKLTDDISFKAITAYRDLKAKFGNDTDASATPFVATRYELDQNQFTQELQLSGDSDRFNWVAGLFYFQENVKERGFVYLAPQLYPALEMLPAPIIPIAPGVNIGGADNPANKTFDFQLNNRYNAKTRSYAAYASASYDLTDRLTINLGGRFTKDKKRFNYTQFRGVTGLVTVPPSSGKDSFNNFSPKVGLDFQATPSALLYLSYSQGFKAGGFNPRAANEASLDSYQPEKVYAYEAGAKTDWLDGLLRLNLAAYFYEYKGIQLQVVRPSGIQGVISSNIENAGDAEFKGVELEMQARPVPQLDLSGSVSWADAKYTRLAEGTILTLNSKLQNAPKWTATGAIQYTVPIGANVSAVLRADMSYRSKVYLESTNKASQNAVTLVNARLTVEHGDGWSFALFGTNLTNRIYAVNGFDFADAGYTTKFYAPPRMYGVSFGYRF